MNISVIIPTYNRARCICNAINSVLEQTIESYEIIVVDDGSTDQTRQTLERYKDKIRYIYQENSGVSAARNRGIKESKFEWLAFLDSDDIWMPEKLYRQTEAIKFTGASVCFSGHEDDFGNKYLDFDEKTPLGDYKYIDSPLDLVFKRNRHPLIQSMLVKKNLVISLGLFDQTLRVSEDTKLIYRIAFKTGIAYINDTLFVLNRNRQVSGLCDDTNLEIALLRYECYCKVQSEAYWSLLPVDIKLSKIVRSNIGYYASLQSEIHSVLKNYKVSRMYAVEGIKHASGYRTFFRCLLLAVVPYLINKYFSRKWKYDPNV